MEKGTGRAAAGGGLLWLEARAAGNERLTTCPGEVNDKFLFHRAGNFNEGPNIHQILAQRIWPDTFRLDRRTLRRPIGPVTRENSWEACLGPPVEQRVRATCVIVACAVCLEARHRLEYEKVHGEGTFPHWVLDYDLLIEACRRDRIWIPGKGASVGKVLGKIKQMGGGVPATAAAPAPAPRVLPLRSWRPHSWDARLSPNLVAALLDSHGPCVGVLWVCPWYKYFDAAASDDALVYRGCGRSEDDREQSKRLYGDQTGWHAVVCFGYRFCGGQMHVLVRDNHNAAANGPQRWVDVEEIHTLYTLSVERLKPWHLLGDR